MNFYGPELPDIGLFLLRFVIGIIFIYHGIPKLQNPKGMAVGIGAPRMSGAVLLLGAVELLAGISIIFGFFTQFAAFLLAVIMVGAIYFKLARWHVPFFAMDKTGWEFDLILLAANMAIILTGGGTLMTV